MTSSVATQGLLEACLMIGIVPAGAVDQLWTAGAIMMHNTHAQSQPTQLLVLA